MCASDLEVGPPFNLGAAVQFERLAFANVRKGQRDYVVRVIRGLLLRIRVVRVVRGLLLRIRAVRVVRGLLLRIRVVRVNPRPSY